MYGTYELIISSPVDTYTAFRIYVYCPYCCWSFVCVRHRRGTGRLHKWKNDSQGPDYYYL